MYQLYPASFADGNGDGWGDLAGVVDRLDHLDRLGVDAVWLNPVYESPMADNGYDVADYRTIDDSFGTMTDWERLRDGLHDRGIRLVMDLVLNHTSAEHEWFERSRRGEAPYDDFYHWVDGDPDDDPPNDWRCFFGGPAWSYDDERGAWYLHLFDETQPDLHWANPRVRAALFDVVEFWVDRGVDGFRLDVLNLVSKPPGYPDAETGAGVVHGADQFVDGPRVHEYVAALHDHVPADAMTVGEMVDLTPAEAERYDDDGMSMVFPFEHVDVDLGDDGRWSVSEWTLPEFAGALERWQRVRAEGRAWVGAFFENHDQPRSVSRLGSDATESERRASGRALATLLLTLGGTPYVYQGQEIGATNYPFESVDEVRDVDTLRNVREALAAGRIDEAEALDLVRYRSRDNARTPMQWSDAPGAGFTDPGVEPWLPLNPDYDRVNVARERADPESVLSRYRDLIALRDAHDVFPYGDYRRHLSDHEALCVCERRLAGADPARVLVVVETGGTERRFDPPDPLAGTAVEPMLGEDEAGTLGPETLDPWGTRLYAVDREI